MEEEGPDFQVDPTQPIEPLLRYVEASVMEVLWEKASKHYLGIGLECGGPAPETFKLLLALRKQEAAEKSRHAGMYPVWRLLV